MLVVVSIRIFRVDELKFNVEIYLRFTYLRIANSELEKRYKIFLCNQKNSLFGFDLIFSCTQISIVVSNCVCTTGHLIDTAAHIRI